MKYEVTDTYKVVKIDDKPILVKHIRALKDFGDVKAGDLGGYVLDENCLSQDGNCWVYDNAVALGEILNNAKLLGDSILGRGCTVSNSAYVKNSTIMNKSIVYGDAHVSNSNIDDVSAVSSNIYESTILGSSITGDTVIKDSRIFDSSVKHASVTNSKINDCKISYITILCSNLTKCAADAYQDEITTIKHCNNLNNLKIPSGATLTKNSDICSFNLATNRYIMYTKKDRTIMVYRSGSISYLSEFKHDYAFKIDGYSRMIRYLIKAAELRIKEKY